MNYEPLLSSFCFPEETTTIAGLKSRSPIIKPFASSSTITPSGWSLEIFETA